MPSDRHLEPGFKRVISGAHQVHPRGTITTALYCRQPSQQTLVQRIKALTNTAGDNWLAPISRRRNLKQLFLLGDGLINHLAHGIYSTL